VVARDDDRYEQLRRRLARVEAVLVSLTFLGPDVVDDETRHFLRRFLRDYDRDWPSADPDHELAYFLDRAVGRASRQSSRIQNLVEFQGRQAEINQGLEQRVGAFQETLDKVSHTIDSLENKNSVLSADTHRWLAFQSLGIDTSEVRLTRFLPLRVFLSDTPGRAIEDISSAIDKLLEAFDFEVSDDFPALHGSWFKKWFAKTTEVATHPEVLERLEKIERAVELKGLGQPQAEIDKKQADAIARLLKAVEKIPNAAIQAGSILLVKLTSSNNPVVQVRTLTQRELIHLENNQQLLTSPADVLEKLSKLCQAPKRKKIAQIPQNDEVN
jgi:hypothetical protein